MKVLFSHKSSFIQDVSQVIVRTRSGNNTWARQFFIGNQGHNPLIHGITYHVEPWISYR